MPVDSKNNQCYICLVSLDVSIRVAIDSGLYHGLQLNTLIHYFKTSIEQSLKHDEINTVKDFDHCLLKIANSLEFGDIRQIILYFGLST